VLFPCTRQVSDSYFFLSARGGQPPDCSKENVITGLQHQSNAELSVSSGLVIQNPPEQVKGESSKPLSFLSM
jgi:hypothetical protein